VAAAPAPTPPPIVEPRDAATRPVPADALALSLGNLEAAVAYLNGNASSDTQRRDTEGRGTEAQSPDLKPPLPSGDTLEAAAPAVEAAPASTPSPTVESSEATTPSAPAPTPLASAEVRELQRRLRAVGFDPGPLDGSAGPTTANAARKYQRARGLAVTGEVDHDLLARLRAERMAARSPSPPRQPRNDFQDFFDGIDRLFRRL
jgi:peptidoglycan hydrolase-like protein with peptidoglycan-binding domain